MAPSHSGATKSECPLRSTKRCGDWSRVSNIPGRTPTRGVQRARMTLPINIGVLQLRMEPVHETAAMAKVCEDAGFDAVWFADAYPWWRIHGFETGSSTAMLVVILPQTRRIQQ